MFRRSKIMKDLLIFLDIDGVLNTTNARVTRYEVRESNVEALGMLAERFGKKGYNVKLILSSTWRLGYEREVERCSPQIQKLIAKLARVGLSIYDRTPVYKECTRDVEIRRYLRGYQPEEEAFEYIILDDDASVFDVDAIKEMNFYRVSEHKGLTRTDVEKLVKLL